MTLEIWKHLQEKDYFKNHKLYNKFEVVIPKDIAIKDIKNKNIMDYGCGYGRNMAWFSNYAKKVIGVDVSSKILKETLIFVKKHGNLNKCLFLLSESYAKHIKNLDYIFCRFVFQHINKFETAKCIEVFSKALKKNGLLNVQFRLGMRTYIEPNEEPIVEYTEEEIRELLSQFRILNYSLHDNHIYLLGQKI